MAKSFEAGDYRYRIQHPLVSHPDYDTLLLASRQHTRGGPLQRVVLKPLRLEHGREARARALEAEAHAILEQASDLEKLGAYPVVERGILPLPPDMPLTNADASED